MLQHEKGSKISWITLPRREGGEWSSFEKNVRVEKEVRQAVFRFESDCVCAVFLNGTFACAGTGRYPERVNCHEITGKLKKGDNTVKLVLGTAYFQEEGFKMMRDRGYWLSSVAFELCVEDTDGNVTTVATDGSWTGEADGKKYETLETTCVTDTEYETFWKNAALWKEPSRHRLPIAPAVSDVAGEEYGAYASVSAPEFAVPQQIAQTNMRRVNDSLTSDHDTAEKPYVIYDFGRLVVGFTELAYEAVQDIELTAYSDYSESLHDFAPDSGFAGMVERLSVKQILSADETETRILRRRAFRYLKLTFSGGFVTLRGAKVRLCMMPEVDRGWFYCSDDLLNKAWETGKYTLHVNKQQEYESCPRNEMEFFSGDGAIDALVDRYAFGETELLRASLGIKEDPRSGGVTFTPKFNRNAIQWDYFAWRIICIDRYYRSSGDRAFLESFYEEAKAALLWQLERVNQFGLMFQRPCFVSSFSFILGQTEWTCSHARLGEKAALNALLYKSLLVMADMAADMGDTANENEWKKKAADLKVAFNERLWNEEKQAYYDSLDTFLAQDGNTLAVLFGLAEGKRAQAVLDTLKKKLWSPYGSALLDEPVSHVRNGSETVAPLMNAYECEARFQNGRADEAIDLIRRCWGTMLKKGAGTFWEFAPNNDHERWDIPSHAWSSGCTYLLSRYVLGIGFAGTGEQTLLFEPNVGDLTEVRGVVPTRQGLVAASFLLSKDNERIFRLAVPKGLKVETKLPPDSTVEILTY